MRAALGRPGLDGRDGVAEDPLLDGLPLAVQLLESSARQVGLALVLAEDQVERDVGPPQPSGRVDARREPEADRGRVDRRRIDARGAHQRAQARLGRARERPQARRGERAVLVDERDDVGDRRQRDEVELARELRDGRGRAAPARACARRRCPRARGTGSRDGRVATTGQSGSVSPGAVVVGDDDLDAELPRARHLGDGGDPAVDGEDQPDALGGEALDGVGRRGRSPPRTGSAGAR